MPEAPEPTLAQKAQHLPELVVENIGLHVGGGPNDAAGKEPFLRALGAQIEAFRLCYRQVEEPDRGGTFGVDLFIDRSGGHPNVRATRTRMKGEEFLECMVRAFENATFERPPKGPTLISYSVRFALHGMR
jgi:hypothetical protein